MMLSIAEARKILGVKYRSMSDEEITKLVSDLDAIAIEALRYTREKRAKEDAMAFAELLYDIYQDKKQPSPDNINKKE